MRETVEPEHLFVIVTLDSFIGALLSHKRGKRENERFGRSVRRVRHTDWACPGLLSNITSARFCMRPVSDWILANLAFKRGSGSDRL